MVLSQKQEGSGNLSNFLQSNLKHQLIVCPRIVLHITAPEMTKATLFSLGSCKATTGTVNSLKDQLQKEKYCKTDKVRISLDSKRGNVWSSGFYLIRTFPFWLVHVMLLNMHLHCIFFSLY